MSDENEVNLGGKLGPRAAKLVTDALIHARQKLGPHQASIAQIVLRDFTNHVSDEVRSVMGDLWQKIADSAEVSEEIKPLLRALSTERGQAWAWIGGAATGAALGPSIGDLFTNLLAPAIHSVIKESPNALLSPEAIASSIARNLGEHLPGVALADEAAKGGLDSDRLRFLVELARQMPTVADLQVLFNRKEIDRVTFAKALERLGYGDDWRKYLIRLADSDFTLADISAMWNRSIINDDEAIMLGARVGYNADQIRKALELGGEPLSPQELGEAFRRGFIDEQRFQRGIVQGPLRSEWFDVLRQLEFSRMSTVDAASAVTQGHMSEAEGRRVAHENGLSPEDFSVLIEIAGRPPGVEFAQDALNRGLIDRDQFRQMFLESAIKNRYLPLLEQMRIRLLPQETARLAYREGVYSRDKALNTLLKHGFSEEDAATLIALEDARQDTTTRELTRAQIVDLYDERIIEAPIATELLTGLGYSPENVRLMMALADLKRTQRYVNAAISRIRSAYLNGRMDGTEASAQLDALGVPVGQRDDLMTIWDIDKSTISKTLSPAQIRQAFRRDLITEDDAIARLTSQGYDDVDARLFLQLTA